MSDDVDIIGHLFDEDKYINYLEEIISKLDKEYNLDLDNLNEVIFNPATLFNEDAIKDFGIF